MTSAIQRAFSYLPVMPSLSSAASTTASCLRRGFSFLSYQNALTAMKGVTLAALGYDIAHNNPILSRTSPTLISSAALLALYSAPWLMRKGAVQILKCLSEPLGLLVAIQLNNPQLVGDLIRSGANVNAQDPRSGLTPLDYARETNRIAILRMLRTAAQDPRGGFTPLLHHACLRHTTSMIPRTLIAGSANAFAFNRKGDSPMRSAAPNDDLDRLKILTGTENHRAFQDCRTIHDFFSILFPPSTESLPTNWERIVTLIPPNPELEELQREATRIAHARQGMQLNLGMDALEIRVCEDLLPESTSAKRSSENATEVALHVLQKASPLFAKAWALANRAQRIILEEISDQNFQNADGTRVDAQGVGAYYEVFGHQIRINRDNDVLNKLNSIIFETMNALQRRSFQRSIELGHSGELGREEYVLLAEWIEYHSSEWQKKILHELGENSNSFSFSDFWLRTNYLPRRQPAGTISHAESYRREWDREVSFRYLSQNQDLLRRRLKELSRTC